MANFAFTNFKCNFDVYFHSLIECSSNFTLFQKKNDIRKNLFHYLFIGLVYVNESSSYINLIDLFIIIFIYYNSKEFSTQNK